MRIEKEIRRAMDSRLSALDASAELKARIRKSIASEEETVVKRRISVGMAFALVALLMLAGVVLAAGLNLFDHDYFGIHDPRLPKIAPETTLQEKPAQTVSSEALGTTVAEIHNAYYDGQSLLVGYSIQNGTRMEPFTPTEEQLGQMTKMEHEVSFISSGEEAEKLTAQLQEAREKGTPFGIAHYSVYPSDHTETDDGIDLPPSTEMDDFTPEGQQYVIREYESPLPEEARNRDSLSIQIPLYQSAVCHYFDGKDMYMLPPQRQDAGAMTAVIPRTNAEVRRFSGEGAYDEVEVQVAAEASAVHASVTVTAREDVFEDLGDDRWYELDLRDEQGNQLFASESGATDPRTLRATLDGTGSLPESLSLTILIESEGEYAKPTPASPILLKPIK